MSSSTAGSFQAVMNSNHKNSPEGTLSVSITNKKRHPKQPRPCHCDHNHSSYSYCYCCCSPSTSVHRRSTIHANQQDYVPR